MHNLAREVGMAWSRQDSVKHVDQLPSLGRWLRVAGRGRKRIISVFAFPSQRGALPLNSWWHYKNYRAKNKIDSEFLALRGAVPCFHLSSYCATWLILNLGREVWLWCSQYSIAIKCVKGVANFFFFFFECCQFPTISLPTQISLLNCSLHRTSFEIFSWFGFIWINTGRSLCAIQVQCFLSDTRQDITHLKSFMTFLK